MKFHLPSYLLGVASAAAFNATRHRVRPVLVETLVLGKIFVRTGRALFERQRENLEDLWAEIDERVRERLRRPTTANGRAKTAASPAAST